MQSRESVSTSPEQRALLCCARVHLDPSSRTELVRLASEGLDFAALVREATRHGVTPLLCRHLSDALRDACPAPVLHELQHNVQRNTLTSFALAAELLAVLEIFSAAEVPAIAVKGPISAALCYGDLGLRTFSDLDILIAPAHVPRATQLLETRGYAPQLELSTAWQVELVRKDTERLFRHPDGLRLVDLHWCLMPRGYSFTPGTGGVFARRQKVRVGKAEVPTLGLEPTLLFLLLHGMKHDWSSLGWLCDVAELVRRHPTLDWDAVLAWSARSGPRRFIDIGLSLAHAVLEAPVPLAVRTRGISDRVVASTVEELRQRLFSARGAGAQSIFEQNLGLAYFRRMQRPLDRMRFVHDVVLRPTQHEWRALPLPTLLAPFHYLVRPIRLVWKHVGLGRKG